MMLHVEVIPAVNPGIKAPLSEAECSGVCRLHEKGVGGGGGGEGGGRRGRLWTKPGPWVHQVYVLSSAVALPLTAWTEA